LEGRRGNNSDGGITENIVKLLQGLPRESRQSCWVWFWFEIGFGFGFGFGFGVGVDFGFVTLLFLTLQTLPSFLDYASFLRCPMTNPRIW
jgi:hypothetical protein